MKKDDTVFLRHILDAIDLIGEYLKDKGYEEFKNNRMIQDAVIRELEIIGEAAKNISEEFRNKHSEIPWRQMTVWDTAIKDIPSLRGKLQEIVKKEEKK